MIVTSVLHPHSRTGRAGNKGFAFTFIMPDQQKYCGDLIKALELSEQKPPDDLMAMWTEYCDQQKAVSPSNRNACRKL